MNNSAVPEPFMVAGADTPLGDERFAALMAALGPFEPAPLVAVGVSGGADSLALVLLADVWARAQGGRAIALSVDHGLRAAAADEAAQVAKWMAARGIEHHILRAAGVPPRRNIQAEARTLRHDLLRRWCGRNGVLHLLLAHHRDDQAETLLLRLARGSGAAGLAGMAAVSWTAAVRVVRPLLPVRRASLERFLRDQGQGWVSDPSNHDPAHGRVRLRGLMPALAAEGADAARLAATARRLGAARRVLEEATADLLARTATPHPSGFIVLDVAGGWGAVEDDVALRALRAVLATVGGRPHGPRADAAVAALARLGQAATVGGCRLYPLKDGRLLVAREARNLPTLDIGPGQSGWWDGRFAVRLAPTAPPGRVAALGAEGWRQIRAVPDGVRVPHRADLPAVVRITVPALWRGGRVDEVPGLGWMRSQGVVTTAPEWALAVRWVPRRCLVSAAFRLAPLSPCAGAV